MALTLKMPEQQDLRPRITVFGVGGAGGNAVNNMIEKNLEGADFVVANTDAQALQQSKAPRRVQLGETVTQGLGAGAQPKVGASAAEETIDEIIDHLSGSHMCFITAGMGGGTGTGAAPVIARAAREMGVLTVGVVTKPFQFEGAHRMKLALSGIQELQQYVDTLIIIPNQNLFRIANERTTFAEAFMLADDVLHQGVKGVTDLMVRPGLINLDFADVRAVMDEMGKAMMGTGEASGESRAVEAAEKAIANPLLDEVSLKGARGVLINITGGYDLTLFELDEAANRIRNEVDPEANIIVGSTLDPDMDGGMRVSVVATGIDAEQARETAPQAQVVQPRTIEPIVSPAMRHQTPAAASPAASPTAPIPSATRPAAARPASRPAPAQVDLDFDIDAGSIQAAPVAAVAPEPDRDAPFIAPRAAAPGDVVADEPHHAAPQPVPAEKEDRHQLFGFNNLIERMTAVGRSREEDPSRAQVEPPVRPAARKAVGQSPHAEDDDLRIEIPSFLRRQAN